MDQLAANGNRAPGGRRSLPHISSHTVLGPKLDYDQMTSPQASWMIPQPPSQYLGLPWYPEHWELTWLDKVWVVLDQQPLSQWELTYQHKYGPFIVLKQLFQSPCLQFRLPSKMILQGALMMVSPGRSAWKSQWAANYWNIAKTSMDLNSSGLKVAILWQYNCLCQPTL